MHDFTPEEMRPKPSSIMFIKMFARLYHQAKTKDNEYISFPITACC